MNLPLNIDWQQILLHMFNFIILAFGLYFILYKPIKSFMDKREEYYKQMDLDANNKKEEADKLLNQYQEKLDNANKEIEDNKATALKEIDAKRVEELNKAKVEASRIIDDAKAQGQKKHDEIVEAANKDICDLAMKACDKLVSKSLDDSYNDFLNTVSKKDN